MKTFADLLAVPPARAEAIRTLAAQLRPGLRVALSTHMNADGDGCGSEAGLARLLRQAGMTVHIVNPTPWPAMFEFLLDGDVRDRSSEGAAALRDVDVIIVLDISDVKRLGALADTMRASTATKLVIDHHIASDESPAKIMLTDTAACATGELIFDMAQLLGWPITEPTAKALYCALLTDTGGFRFSNTTPRCHAVASALLTAGVAPEEMYRRIYASVPLGRLELLRDALATLKVDAARGLAWVSVPAGALEKYSLTNEDLDGIVEHPRSINGTKLAIFFRDLGHGKVKVSFRSTGEVDVNAFAKQFGGGGHARASGALVAGSLAEVEANVTKQAAAFLDNGSSD